MSAFVVSEEHVAMMVRAGLTADSYGPLRWYYGESLEFHGELTPGTVNAVGEMLFAENQKSVNARYSENDAPPAFDYISIRPGMRDATPVEVLKGIGCFEYQSCETAEWNKSEAHSFCRALESAMIHALPGYDSAPWEWNADNAR